MYHNYKTPSTNPVYPQLPLFYPMIKGLNSAEALMLLRPYSDKLNCDCVAFFCLSLQEPQAYDMFWLTHQKNNNYSHVDMISAIFDKKYSCVATSCKEYYSKAKNFLIELIDIGFMPQDQIDCLKSEEGQKYVEYLVGRESNAEYEKSMLLAGLNRAAPQNILALINQRDKNHHFYPGLLIEIEKAQLQRDCQKLPSNFLNPSFKI